MGHPGVWGGLGRTGNNKGEIQGSLHCAPHGETVRGFGRDDVQFEERVGESNSNGNGRNNSYGKSDP